METGNNINVFKVKTHIHGLDNILHGGLVCKEKIRSEGSVSGGKEPDGVLISLNGQRGVTKTDFAIHICHGVTRSLNRHFKETIKKGPKSKVFSVSKTSDILRDSHDNVAISRLIEWSIQDYVANKHRGDIGSSLLLNVVKTFFSEKVSYKEETDNQFCFDYDDTRICEMLADGSVYYNIHSKTLNIKHIKRNSGKNHIRKFGGMRMGENSIQEYINEYSLPIAFDGFDNEKRTKFISRFEDILDSIVDMYERENESGKLYCLVIDGFSQLTDEELKTVPIDYLQRVLRRIAYVTILVFDERGNDFCRNSDIVLKLDRNTDGEVGSLSYNTLEIKKCLIQKYTSGKHLYKLLDTGISVFPSLEYILNYSEIKSSSYSDLGRGMFNTSYGSYLKGFHRRVINNPEQHYSEELYENRGNTIESNKATYEDFLDNYQSQRDLYISVMRQQLTTSIEKNACEKLLNNILFRTEIPDYNIQDPYSDNLITVLVGYQNTFKRMLSNAVIFNSLRHNNQVHEMCDVTKDVLYISFNNNRTSLLKTVACPCVKDNFDMAKCPDCYAKIHMYSVPFGDISASELIYKIDDIIDGFNNVKSRHVIGQIMIDKLNEHMVQNAHPFIYKDKLLIPALFKLLREKQIPTIIISDIMEKGYQDVCNFADNVIYTERKLVSEAPFKELLNLYVAKDYRFCDPRTLYGCSIRISEKQNIIKYCGDRFALNHDIIIDDREVSPVELERLIHGNNNN